MDVDSELDQDLLSKFSSMNTTDRDVLVCQLERVLDFQLNKAGCMFFLDMTSWNLQAAVGAYYDFNSVQSERLPSMEFLQDITIGEGEAVPPSTKFLKTWRLRNNGIESWPAGAFLRFTHGDQLGPLTTVLVESLLPMSSTNVSVEMISPSRNGIYQGQWRMCTPTGQYFGDIIWVIIGVKEDGLLGVTQQLSELGHPESSPIKPALDHRTENAALNNPFASPVVPAVPFNSPVKSAGEQSHRTSRRELFQMPEMDENSPSKSREQ